ncbi:MAG: 3-phosphoshikimate 1-carboxyvinyltransferase [Gammaproteobacteria bacterium]|nr:3-phosphoshikimate 1-carboxyvinyltransferase [Gammaproteobacteria bacterium]
MAAKQYIEASPGRATGGTVAVPGDKSISHRSLMFGALADGTTTVKGFLAGEDCLATMAAMQALGVRIDTATDGTVTIAGVGMNGLRQAAHALDMGNSGTGLRLLAGLLAGQSFSSELTGDDSLRSRPMERIAGPLRDMGATVTTTDGRAPLTVGGSTPLKPIEYVSPVASAQVKSAILLAGLYADGTTTVVEPGITRDHTERMLRTFGVPVSSGELTASLTGPATLSACDVQVPGDLSSAAFALGAGCLARSGEVVVVNVGINPTRTGVLDILKLMGADISIREESRLGDEPVATLVARPSALRGADIPAELIPLAIDELPLIFALAACAEGDTVVSGAEELRHKESDRIALMVQGLQALGASVEERSDGARISGGPLHGGTVESADDHRIAMAFCIAAGAASAPVTIRDTENIATSFPGFVPLMQSLGLRLTEFGRD